MTNKKRTTMARVAVVVIGIIVAAVLLMAIFAPGGERTLVDLEVVPARVTDHGTIPQEYWAKYRLEYGDGTCDYHWVKITRQQFADLKSKGAGK